MYATPIRGAGAESCRRRVLIAGVGFLAHGPPPWAPRASSVASARPWPPFHFHFCVVNGLCERAPGIGGLDPETHLCSHEAMDMLTWDHDGGLSLDAKVLTEAIKRAGLVRLIRCCLRPPIALDR
jgi:hypothetical protein